MTFEEIAEYVQAILATIHFRMLHL